MARLTIYDRRERALVRAADVLLAPACLRRLRRKRMRAVPARVLCLRLERIGDLLMMLPALGALRARLPDARIDLAVGSWNRTLASAIPGIDNIITMDAAWLSRGGAGRSVTALLGDARQFRLTDYDLAVNFEPDIRSNLVLAASGAAWTAGYSSGGGGALLDVAIEYDTRLHTSENALRLVDVAAGLPDAVPAVTLALDDRARDEAEALLADAPGRPLIGMHVSGGRPIKQWPIERFAEAAARLIADRGAVIVLTGTAADREMVAAVRAALPAARVIDASGRLDLLTLAAVLARLDLLVTGDTGPMHLAQAVGTPAVAVFGPSDPARYAPRGIHDRVVRVDLPCSPCNRIRRPPARCQGHTPDCLAGVQTSAVLAAIDDVLRERDA